MSTIYKSVEGRQVIMNLYDRVLAVWPVPHQTFNVPTRHGNTFIIQSGADNAPPLILLHGSCSNAVSWAGDVAAYSECLRVLAVDLPGEPGRSEPVRPDWNGPAYAEWLDDILDYLSIETAVLLGISQGGWSALRFATIHPEKVNRLVLIAPGGVVPVRFSFILRAVLLSLLGRRGAEAITRITFGDTPVPDEAAAFTKAIMTHFKPRIGAPPIFSDTELQSLTMPSLLIAGARDALFPSEKTANRLKEHVPDLTCTFLPDEGHALINQAGRVMPFLSTKKKGKLLEAVI